MGEEMKDDASGTYLKVEVLENDFEAQLLDSILTERQIPHLMRSYHDTAYDGLYQAQKGWGYVSAPEPFKTVIQGILAEIRSQAGDFPVSQ